MLKQATVSVIIIYEVYLGNLCECMRKNVCKSLQDYRTLQYNPNCWFNPDVGANPSEIAQRYGFPFETHEVTTSDGYVVTLFRIPHNGTYSEAQRPAVLIQHGFAADGTVWMINGLKSSVFIFANQGYDVWISNSRGTKYSSKHLKYTVYDPEYWNFSFHEIALYDIPAMLEYIGQKTGQTGHLSYVGHSMGSTISYVYASLKSEHAQTHLKSIVSLAPVAYMDNVVSVVKTFAPFRNLVWGLAWHLIFAVFFLMFEIYDASILVNSLEKDILLMPSELILINFFVSIGLYGFGPNVQFKVDLLHRLCATYPFIILCAQAGGLFAGINPKETQANDLPVAYSNFPSGFSLKTLMHFAQIMAAEGKFQAFDYGPDLNVFFYNTSLPPEYPLSRIKVPIHLFYGNNDLLAREKDVFHLYNQLETEKTVMEVFSLAHFDFLSGPSAEKLYRILFKYL